MRSALCSCWPFGVAALLVSTATGWTQAYAPLPPDPSREVRAETPRSLRPVFAPGNTYRFVVSSVVRMSIPARGIREVRLDQQARYDALARPGGKKGVRLEALTERLEVKVRSRGKTLTYDSMNKEDRTTTLGQHFQARVNRRVRMDLNEDLRIVAFEEFGPSSTETSLPELPDFGPDELRHLVALIPQGFPEHPVMTGEKWNLRGIREVEGADTLTFDLAYRHQGYQMHEQETCVGIVFGGTMAGEASEANFSGARVQGQILFDPALEMTRQAEQTISLSLTVPHPQHENVPVAVPVQQEQSFRLLHVVPAKAR